MSEDASDEQGRDRRAYFSSIQTVSGENDFTKLPPKLARKIGIPLTLVLSHIYFRLCISEVTSKDGNLWAQIPSTDFTKRLPLCKKAVRNAIEDLTAYKFIKVYQDETIRHGLWYSINPENQERIELEMNRLGKKLTRPKRNNRKSKQSKRGKHD